MYLRGPRFFFFFLTSALCAATTGLTSWGLYIGVNRKHQVRDALKAKLIIGDALGVGGAVTAAAGIASGLCTIMLGLALFRPHMRQTLRVVQMKEAAFAFSVIFFIATLIPATYIAATRSGVVYKAGVSSALLANIVSLTGQSLAYKDTPAIIAYICTGWAAMLSTSISLLLVSLEARYVMKNGPDGEIGEIVGHHHREDAASTAAARDGTAAADKDSLENTHHEKAALHA